MEPNSTEPAIRVASSAQPLPTTTASRNRLVVLVALLLLGLTVLASAAAMYFSSRQNPKNSEIKPSSQEQQQEATVGTEEPSEGNETTEANNLTAKVQIPEWQLTPDCLKFQNSELTAWRDGCRLNDIGADGPEIIFEGCDFQREETQCVYPYTRLYLVAENNGYRLIRYGGEGGDGWLDVYDFSFSGKSDYETKHSKAIQADFTGAPGEHKNTAVCQDLDTAAAWESTCISNWSELSASQQEEVKKVHDYYFLLEKYDLDFD